MTKIEREKIVDFIDALMESDYSRANKDLGVVVKEKIKAKLEKAKHVKPFGEKAETEDCDCEDEKPKKKSEKGETKKAKGEKKEKNLPPWLKKKAKK
jgi:hypothetical protein